MAIANGFGPSARPHDSSAEPIIAVIEQHDNARNQLISQLSQQGFQVWGAPSAELFYQRLITETVHIILFDLNSSLQPCYEAIAPIGSRQEMGLIALHDTANSDTEHQALQAGADYVLAKPIDEKMLLVTLDALWRRMEQQSPQHGHSGVWQLNPKTSELMINNQTRIKLSNQEYEFLDYLMTRPNGVVDKEELHQMLFPDYDEFESHRISVLLNRLRFKTKQSGHRLPIRALYGRGLVFVDEHPITRSGATDSF